MTQSIDKELRSLSIGLDDQSTDSVSNQITNQVRVEHSLSTQSYNPLPSVGSLQLPEVGSNIFSPSDSNLGCSGSVKQERCSCSAHLLLSETDEQLIRATASAVVAASERQLRTAITEVPVNLYHFGSDQRLACRHSSLSTSLMTGEAPYGGHLGRWTSLDAGSRPRRLYKELSPDVKSAASICVPRRFDFVEPTPSHQPSNSFKLNRSQLMSGKIQRGQVLSTRQQSGEADLLQPDKQRFKRHASERISKPFRRFTATMLRKSESVLAKRRSTRLKLDNSTDKTNVGASQLESGPDSDKECGQPGDDEKQTTSYYLKQQFLSFFQPTDNKLAMKLFGTKRALDLERKRQKQQGRLVIHPCSSFRFYWDVIMLLLLIANLIILPVGISFFIDDLGSGWTVFNGCSDAVFLIDIVVNFRTGVIINNFADEIMLNPKEIARHYIKTWFFLDLLSSLPLDYIYHISDGHNWNYLRAGRALRFLRFMKLLSLIRLLRLSRLVRYVSQWEEFLNIAGKFIGISNLVLLMLLLGHWNACLQFLIPTINEYPVNSWVIKCKLKDATWFEQYTWALFKAMSHMLSIGYGRYPPTSISEAWVTLVSMVSGATCYALFVGHAAALIQSFDCSKRLYREKFKQVEEYMAFRKLPRALRQRIASYYEHRYQGKMFNENEILNELSECLKEQIINYNCRALVAAVPFFTFADQNFVSEVVVKLRYEVFQPGDIIIKEGTIGYKMYFIQEGIVDIVTREGEIATSLSDGSYFGEICLLTNAKRVASVRAETYCNVYSLDRTSFLEVLDNYPLMRRTMESVAAERLQKLGRDPLTVSKRKDLYDDLKLVNEIVNQAIAEDSGTETEQMEKVDKTQRTSSTKLSWDLLGLGRHKSYHNLTPTDTSRQNRSISLGSVGLYGHTLLDRTKAYFKRYQMRPRKQRNVSSPKLNVDMNLFNTENNSPPNAVRSRANDFRVLPKFIITADSTNEMRTFVNDALVIPVDLNQNYTADEAELPPSIYRVNSKSKVSSNTVQRAQSLPLIESNRLTVARSTKRSSFDIFSSIYLK